MPCFIRSQVDASSTSDTFMWSVVAVFPYDVAPDQHESCCAGEKRAQRIVQTLLLAVPTSSLSSDRAWSERIEREMSQQNRHVRLGLLLDERISKNSLSL